ncbi:PHA-depolymerase-like protein [Oxalobacteraceae bacterium OM1]|nr:PHA-depolymerase-like protein [Oxalobacteraceae bacterium OM1]
MQLATVARLILLLALLIVAAAVTARAAPVALPSFRIDLDETSVSGLSSGGFMAVQVSVAYSSIIKGAGIVAGGPYYCAQGDLGIATTRCSCTSFFSFANCQVKAGGTALDKLVAVTERDAQAGKIDSPSHLARQRLWLFSGTRDSVVPSPVMRDLADYYARLGTPENIILRNDVPAQHAFPTDGYGNACGKLGSPYMNDCGVDAAGELLKWIYADELRPKSNAGPAGRMIEFDQSEFFEDRRPVEHGMAERGYAYIPQTCDQGRTCRLHIAFHGCAQNTEEVRDAFIRHGGYNAWADSNGLIVLYPQTSATPANPNACWNWLDFERDDPDYANKNGRQMRAVKGMIDRIAGRTSPPPPMRLPQCFTASNAEHVRAGRAYDWFFLARATGSDQFIGLDNAGTVTTLKQTAPGHYQAGICP